jgi:hypothetical protein
MDELQKLYNVLVREGKYTKDFEQFKIKFQDSEYQSKVFDVVSRDGLYTKDKDSFLKKYSINSSLKKKDVTSVLPEQQVAKPMASPLADGSSASRQIDDLTKIGKPQQTLPLVLTEKGKKTYVEPIEAVIDKNLEADRIKFALNEQNTQDMINSMMSSGDPKKQADAAVYQEKFNQYKDQSLPQKQQIQKQFIEQERVNTNKNISDITNKISDFKSKGLSDDSEQVSILNLQLRNEQRKPVNVINSILTEDEIKGLGSSNEDIIDYLENLKETQPDKYEYLLTKADKNLLGSNLLTKEQKAKLINDALNFKVAKTYNDYIYLKDTGVIENVNKNFEKYSELVNTSNKINEYIDVYESRKQNGTLTIEDAKKYKILLGKKQDIDSDIKDYDASGFKDQLEKVKDIHDVMEQNSAEWVKANLVMDGGLDKKERAIKSATEFRENNPIIGGANEIAKSIWNNIIVEPLRGAAGLGTFFGSNIKEGLTGKDMTYRSGAQLDFINDLADSLSFEKAESDTLDKNGDIIWGNIANNTADSITQMLGLMIGGSGGTKIATAFGAGAKTSAKIGTVLGSFGMSRGDYYGEYLNAGMSVSDASKYANGAAALTSLLELVSPNDAVRSILTGANLKKKFVTESAKYFSEKGYKYGIKKGVEFLVKEIGSENIQEMSQNLGDLAVKYVANQNANKELFDLNMKDFLKDTKETILLTTLTTGIVSGVGVKSEIREQKNQYKFNAAENYDSFMKNIPNVNITEEQKNKVIDDVANYKKAMDSLPPDMKEGKKREIIPALVRKNKLEVIVKDNNLDDVFKDKAKAELEQVTELIKKYNDGDKNTKISLVNDDPSLPLFGKEKVLPIKEEKSLAQQYIESITKAKTDSPSLFWSVDMPFQKEDGTIDEEQLKLAESEGRLIKTDAGFGVVSKDGDIKGVFKSDLASTEKTGDQVIKAAIKAGGIKLDNFALPNLMKIYQRNGFRVVSRLPFNEEFAPEGWNKEEHGTPDVVAMVYDPENKLDIEEKQFQDYDEAMSYRDGFVDQTKAPAVESTVATEEVVTEELSDEAKRLNELLNITTTEVTAPAPKKTRKKSVKVAPTVVEPPAIEVVAAEEPVVKAPKKGAKKVSPIIVEAPVVEEEVKAPTKEDELQAKIDETEANYSKEFFRISAEKKSIRESDLTKEQKDAKLKELNNELNEAVKVRKDLLATQERDLRLERGTTIQYQLKTDTNEDLSEEDAQEVENIFNEELNNVDRESSESFDIESQLDPTIETQQLEVKSTDKRPEATLMSKLRIPLNFIFGKSVGLGMSDTLTTGERNVEELNPKTGNIEKKTIRDEGGIGYPFKSLMDVIDGTLKAGKKIYGWAAVSKGAGSAMINAAEKADKISGKDLKKYYFDNLDLTEEQKKRLSDAIPDNKEFGLVTIYKMGEDGIKSNEAYSSEALRQIEAKLNDAEKKTFFDLAKKRLKSISWKDESKYGYLFENINNFDQLNNLLNSRDLKLPLGVKADILQKVFLSTELTESKPGVNPIGDLLKSKGISIESISRVIEEPVMNGVNVGQPMILIAIDPKSKVVEDKNRERHNNYPFGVEGFPIGLFNETTQMHHLSPQMMDSFVKTATVIVDEKAKFKGKKVRISISQDSQGIFKAEEGKGTNKSSIETAKSLEELKDKLKKQGYTLSEEVLSKRYTQKINGTTYNNLLQKAKSGFMSIFKNPKLSAQEKLVKFLQKTFPGIAVEINTAEYENIQNDLRAKKLLNKSGETYGFVKDGRIYLNPKFLNNNTPIHEFGHVWNAFAKNFRPEIYNKGVELIKNSRYFDSILNNASYQKMIKSEFGNNAIIKDKQTGKFKVNETNPNFDKINDYLYDESLAKAIGNKGELFVNEAQKRNFTNWLKDLYKAIQKVVGFESMTSDQFQNLKLNEFVNAAVKELLSGKEISKITTKELSDISETKMKFDISDEMAKIIDVGQKNNISNSAIKELLKAKGFSVEEINEAFPRELTKPMDILSTAAKSDPSTRKEELLSAIDKIISKGKITIKNAESLKLKLSKLNTDSDAQVKKFLDNANKMFTKKPIIEYIREAYKSTINDISKRRSAISDAIKLMVNDGSITLKQSSSLISRLEKLNVNSDAQVNRFLDYAKKVFDKANYVELLSKANKTKNEIAKLSRDPKKNANLTALGKRFIEIKPSMVEDIDAYNDIALRIKNAIQGSKIIGEGLKAVDMVNIEDSFKYIDETIKAQRDKIFKDRAAEIQELMGVDASDFSYEEMEEFFNSMPKENESAKTDKYKETVLRDATKKMFDTYSALINEMFKTGYDAFYTGEKIEYSSKDKDLVNRFMNMDLSILTPKQTLEAVDSLANFLENQSTAKMEDVLERYTGELEMNKLSKEKVKARSLKLYWNKSVGGFFADQFSSLPLIFEKMFGGFNAGSRVMKASGITELSNKKSAAVTQVESIINDYVNDFKGSKPNGQDFNSASNVIERGLAAHMMRSLIGTKDQIAAEFKLRKAWIEESINVLSKGSVKEKEKSVLYQNAYDKILKDSNNANDVISKTDKENLRAVKWWIDKWNENYEEMADVSLNVYNKILDKDLNYTPDRMPKLETKTDEVNLSSNDSQFSQMNGTLYDKESGSLMKAVKPEKLPAKRYIDLSFDTVNSSAMYDTMIDIKTAASIKRVEAFLNSKYFDDVFSDSGDGDLLKDRIKLYVRNIRNKNIYSNDTFSKAIRSLERIVNIGVGQALGGITQPIKQVIPVVTNTLINSGKLDLGILFNQGQLGFISRAGRAISNRGQEAQTGIESVNKLIDLASRSNSKKAIKLIEDANKMWLKIFLQKPDVFIAKASWISYYEKSLKQQGVDISKLDYKTDEVNEQAADYAQSMVDRQQNISDSDMAGAIFNTKDSAKKFIVNTLMPFASFRMNQTMRMMTDISNLQYWNTMSVEDRKIAAKSLAGFAAEMATFKIASIGFSLLYGSLANLIMGYYEDDEEKEKRIKLAIKGQATSLVTDLISPLPVFDKPIAAASNYILKKVQTASGVKKEDVFEIYGGTTVELAQSFGTLGIAAGKATKLAESIELATTGKYVDDFGKEKKLSYKAEEGAKIASALYLLGTIGILPPAESGSVANNIIRKAKKDVKKAKSKGSLDIENEEGMVKEPKTDEEKEVDEFYKEALKEMENQ